MQYAIDEWQKKYIGQLVVPVEWFCKLPQDLLEELVDANPDVVTRALNECWQLEDK